MIVLDSFLIALKALRVNKLRTCLTMLGMIIGVAAVMTMVALGNGAQASVEEEMKSAGHEPGLHQRRQLHARRRRGEGGRRPWRGAHACRGRWRSDRREGQGDQALVGRGQRPRTDDRQRELLRQGDRHVGRFRARPLVGDAARRDVRAPVTSATRRRSR